MKRLAVVTMLLLLAGCGGDGGGNGVEMPEDGTPLTSDERGERLVRIVEHANTLHVPGAHVSYSVSALGETDEGSLFEPVSCGGIRCSAESLGVELDLDLSALVDLDIDISVSEANLQSRDGFDTADVRGSLDLSDIGVVLPGITVTEIPEVEVYGFWGEHGMAGLALADGPYAGQIQIDDDDNMFAIPFDGRMKVVIPFALGAASGTNPSGMGSATWTGIAEAVSPRTFMRREGTATLTIADLSLTEPAVSVAIDIDGSPIDKPGWTDMPLAGGHFQYGTAEADYLEGNFHGAEHSEAYGVFDTDTFTGAFGAKRQGESE